MQFVKQDLELIKEALGLAQVEIDTQIGNCPDPASYVYEIYSLRGKQAAFQELLNKMDIDQGFL